MRRFVLILCLLVNASFALTPFATLHAHVHHEHDHFQVHGGHTHDFDGSSIEDEVNLVIKLPAGAADQGGSTFTWTYWVPLVYVIGVLLGLALSERLLRPHRKTPLPSSSIAYGLPPVRGPPPNSIAAL